MKRAFAHFIRRKQRVKRGMCARVVSAGNARRRVFCKTKAATGSEYCSRHLKESTV